MTTTEKVELERADYPVYRRSMIEEVANALRCEFHMKSPLDLEELVRNLGGRLKIVPEWTVPQRAGGMVRRDGDSFEILVEDRYGDKERKNSLIASLIGHLFLHMGYLHNDTLWKHSGGYLGTGIQCSLPISVSSRQASEASLFRYALLMPADEFKDVATKFKDGRHCLVRPIAAHFCVTTDAAMIRGHELGLFDWNELNEK